MADNVVVIGGEVTLESIIDGDASLSLSSDGVYGSIMQYDSHSLYAGSYEFTPSAERQTISIGDKIASQDITINPIPSNYGLVTWNGSFLTIS